MRSHTFVWSLIVGLLIGNVFLMACSSPASETEAPPAQPPSGESAALMEERCATCHSLDQVTQASKTREEWEQTVIRMVAKGARLSEDEQAALIEYLAATYGP